MQQSSKSNHLQTRLLTIKQKNLEISVESQMEK